MSKCLYCPADGDTLEHALPAAFGEFANAPNLDRHICAGCNTRGLSLLDQQISRCGPEGFLRELYGVRGRKGHARVNPFARGSAGGKRLQFSTLDREVGVEVNLEVDDGVVRQMCELIFVETDSGKVHHLPLSENMTAAQVRTERDRLAVAQLFETHVSYDPCEREWIEKLMREVAPAVTFSEGKRMSTVIEQPKVSFDLGERYYIAFAKIGLHYFLTQFPTYSGHESIFAEIRKFIYEDTNEPIHRVNEFISVRQHPLLIEMLSPGSRPDGWRAHVLAAEAKPGICAAHVQLFLTEDWAGQTLTITLARDVSITEQNAFAHAYHYYPEGRRGRFSGEAWPLAPLRTGTAFPPAKPVIVVG